MKGVFSVMGREYKKDNRMKEKRGRVNWSGRKLKGKELCRISLRGEGLGFTLSRKGDPI